MYFYPKLLRCGYVLKPDLMMNPEYNPYDFAALRGSIEAVILIVTVLGGRNLNPSGSASGIICPFVVVETIGLSIDNDRKRTRNLKGMCQ